MKRRPGERLLAILERRVVEISREFDAQHCSATLWALTMIGRNPKEQVLKMLAHRMVHLSADFSAQQVAMMLWAACFFCMHTPDICHSFFRALSPGFSTLLKDAGSTLVSYPGDVKGSRELSQLHQFFLSCDFEEGLRPGLTESLLALKDTLGPACRANFSLAPGEASHRQKQVSDTFREMGLSVEDEFRCEKSGYSIDMRVCEVRRREDIGVSSNGGVGVGVGWAVEFDGPKHFLACRSPTGTTVIKRRHLQHVGYNFVSIPFWVSL
jgi:hypothetical protein